MPAECSKGTTRQDTVFPENDHRRHRPRSWLINGIQKVEQLRFLERPGRTLGQAAIQWLLHEPRVMTVLPNIYDLRSVARICCRAGIAGA